MFFNSTHGVGATFCLTDQSKSRKNSFGGGSGSNLSNIDSGTESTAISRSNPQAKSIPGSKNNPDTRYEMCKF